MRRQRLRRPAISQSPVPVVGHLHAMADLEQLGSQTAGIDSRRGAHGAEIGVILKQKSLRLALRPKSSVSPIFHRHNDHRRPKPSFGDRLFRNTFMRIEVRTRSHFFFPRRGPRSTPLLEEKHSPGQPPSFNLSPRMPCRVMHPREIRMARSSQRPFRKEATVIAKPKPEQLFRFGATEVG